MKKVKSVFFLASLMAVAAFSFFPATAPAAPVTFTIFPSVISNSFHGPVAFKLAGLTNGEPVVFDNFADLNGDGVIDAGDLWLDDFQLADGRNEVIGGATNLNVPADLSGVDGTIVAQLHYYLNDVHQAVGGYLYRVSSPTGRFPAITDRFAITNWPYSQSVTGLVTCAATNVPGAFVVLLDGVVQSVIGGVMTDGSGAFTLHLPPGDYVLIPVKDGLVADAGASPIITVPPNGQATANLELFPAANVFAGRVVESVNTNLGVGGIFLVMQSDDGLLATATTDTKGNFSRAVTADNWQIILPSFTLAAHGFVEPKNGTLPSYDTTTGSLFNAEVPIARATAIFHGSIKNEAGGGLSEVQAGGNHSTQPFNTDGWTDDNGNYALAAIAGDWRISIAEENIVLPHGNLVSPAAADPLPSLRIRRCRLTSWPIRPPTFR